jgi:hypothetical protein
VSTDSLVSVNRLDVSVACPDRGQQGTRTRWGSASTPRAAGRQNGGSPGKGYGQQNKDHGQRIHNVPRVQWSAASRL